MTATAPVTPTAVQNPTDDLQALRQPTKVDPKESQGTQALVAAPTVNHSTAAAAASRSKVTGSLLDVTIVILAILLVFGIVKFRKG